MRSSNKMQITYFIFNILSLVIISFDSSSNALSKFFWAQLDRMKRSVAKSWKTRAHFQFSWISLSSRDQISYQTQIPCRAYQYRCLLTVRIKRPHRIGWKPIVPRASVNKKRKSPPRARRSFFFCLKIFFCRRIDHLVATDANIRLRPCEPKLVGKCFELALFIFSNLNSFNWDN